MEKKVYVLFDKKLGVYCDPIFQPYDPENMKELYRRAVLSGSVPNADDLELYHLGSYDDKTAVYSSLAKPFFICYLGEFSNGTKVTEIKPVA